MGKLSPIIPTETRSYLIYIAHHMKSICLDLAHSSCAGAGSPEKTRGKKENVYNGTKLDTVWINNVGSNRRIEPGLGLGRYHMLYRVVVASWNSMQLRLSDIPSQHRSNPHDSSSGKYVWSYHLIVSFQSLFLRRRSEKYLVPLAQSP